MSPSSDEALDGFIGALLDDDPEQLYDRAPCGYLSTSPDGTIVKVNRTFLTLIGYARDEVVGRLRFADLLAPGGRIYHETHYAPMLRMQGAAREIALDLVHRDGSRVPVLVNSVLDHDAEGNPAVVRTAVFDARQRREYERELLGAKERAEASEARALRLARTLQQTLIPPAPPVIPQLDVAARYRPAGSGAEVGGDFYDVFQAGEHDWVVVVGDVCGKGTAAAVVTALARHTLRAAAAWNPSPAGTLRALNDALLDGDTDRFCTVVLLRLTHDAGSWSGVVASGGHPLPLLCRDGAARPLGAAGSLLGVFPDAELTETSFTLDPGDALVLYTDGVPEGRHGRAFYGEDRLEVVAAQPYPDAEARANAVLSDVLDFQEGVARDDIAVVVVGVPPR